MKRLLGILIVLAGSAPGAPAEPAGFVPVLIQAKFDRHKVEPGGEIHAEFTMANVGPTGSLFPLRLHLEATLAGSDKPETLRAEGEPFPPTTLWKTQTAVSFGLAVSIPAQARPGDYEVTVFLRPKDGGAVVPWQPSGAPARETVPLGRITVLEKSAPAEPPVPRVETLAPLPQTDAPSLPDHPTGPSLVLSNDRVHVWLDPQQPRLLAVGRTAESGLGAPGRTGQPIFQIFRKTDGAWFSSASSPEIQIRHTVTASSARVSYRTTIACEGRPAAACTLFFTLAGDELRVGFEDVREESDFLLTTIAWPRLIGSDAPGARLVNGRFSGRLIDPARCVPGTVTHEPTWIDPFVGGVLYTSEVLAAVGIDSPGDRITSSVGREGSRPSVGFGLEFTHYVVARGHPWEHWIHAAGDSMARLRLLVRPPNAEALTWVDGARLLRREISDITPPSIYQDSVIYKILMDSKDYTEVPADLPATSSSRRR